MVETYGTGQNQFTFAKSAPPTTGTSYGTGANQFSFYRPTTTQAVGQVLRNTGSSIANALNYYNPLNVWQQTQASNQYLDQQQRLQAEQQKAFSDAAIRAKNAPKTNTTNPPPGARERQASGGGGGGGGSDAGKQYGGWYWRPELGKAMRWFNGEWTDGSEPGGAISAVDIAELSPAGEGFPKFDFSWEEAERVALEKLTPYYEELIAEAQGDMDLAIKRLTEDYDTGVRYANENWQTLVDKVQQDYFIADRVRQENLVSNTGRTMEDMYREKRLAEEDAATQTREAQRLEPQETAATREAMNKRNVLESSISIAEQSDLSARQAARREAINTALARKQEAASINAARGTSDLNTDYARQVEQADLDKLRTLQDADVTKARAIEGATTPYQRAIQDYEIQFPRYLRDLNQEKVEKASGMAGMEYQKDWGRYQQEKDQYYAGFNS